MATPVIMPRQGQSVESCILVEWLVQAGDTIAEGAPVANIETDKATFEIEAPAAGTVLALFAAAGDDIPVLQNIAAIGSPGEDVSSLRPGGMPADVPPPPTVTAPAAQPAATPLPPAAAGPAVGVSPRARKTAEAKGVAAANLAGSGPAGRVIERDVLAAAAAGPHMSAAARDAARTAGVTPPAAGSGPGGLVLAADLVAQPAAAAAIAAPPTAAASETKLSGIRKLIARRMHESLAKTAQLTMHRSFDAAVLLALRKRIKADGEKLGLPNVTLNDMIAFALARLLARHPEINARFEGDRLIHPGTANLGVAVDTPRGLMVPVIRSAETLSLGALSTQVRDLAKACQQGSVNPDLLGGGSFTLTTLGAMGIDAFTPILNAPEVAILGVGGLTLKPVRAEDGTVRHIDAMGLSLTIDHQVVDGAPGARFLQELAQALENFDLLLAGGKEALT